MQHRRDRDVRLLLECLLAFCDQIVDRRLPVVVCFVSIQDALVARVEDAAGAAQEAASVSFGRELDQVLGGSQPVSCHGSIPRAVLGGFAALLRPRLCRVFQDGFEHRIMALELIVE